MSLNLVQREIATAAIVAACYLGMDLTITSVQQYVLAPPNSNATVASLEGFAIGAMFAQIVVLAIWSGLSAEKTGLRISLGLLVIVLGARLMSLFTKTFSPQVLLVREAWGADRFGWLFLVLLFSSIQFGFIMYRRWTGYQLTLGDSPVSQIRRGAYSLAELVALPAFFCVPLVVLPAILDLITAGKALLCLLGLVLACKFYAFFHLRAFLRDSVSTSYLVVLMFVCPMFLLPASMAITGQMNGTIHGVPFVAIIISVHLGAITIGISTGLFARFAGYRIASAVTQVPTFGE